MNHRNAIVMLLGLLAFCATPASLAQIVPPDETSRVEAFPNAAAPANRIKIVGQDLQATHSYTVALAPVRGTDTNLGNVTTNSIGDFALSVDVPIGFAAGSYELLVRDSIGLPPRPIRARTPFTVLGPLSITTLSGLSPRPGYRMSVTVGGLVPGTLEFKYADGTVYGPMTVKAATAQFGFIIPSDRPASLPATVPLLAINRVGHLTVNTATNTINVSARSLTPVQIGNVTAPPTIRPTVAVPLTGRLTREDGIRPGTQVDAYWFGNDGSVIPMPGNAVAFDAQGNFSLNTQTPGLMSMTSGMASGAGQLRFISREAAGYAGDDDIEYGIDLGTGAITSAAHAQRLQLGVANASVTAARIPADGLITFIVRGTNNQVIPNAVVEIAPSDNSPYAQSFLTSLNGSDQAGRSGRHTSLGGTSQYAVNSAELAQAIGVGPAPFVTPDCPATLKRQVTDAQGRVQFQLDMNAISELVGDIVCDGVSGPNDELNCHPAQAIFFQVTFYAGQSGYGHRNPFTEAYLPAKFEMVYYFDRDYADLEVGGLVFQFTPTESIFDNYDTTATSTFSPTMTLRLPPLSVPAVVLENINMSGLPRESAPPTGGGLPPGTNAAAWFAPRLTFPLVTGTFASANPIYSMFFSHSPLVGGTLINASFWFDTDDNGSLNQVGNFVFSNNQRGQCGLTTLDTYELPFGANSSNLGLVFRYGLNNHAAERVERCGEIRATNQAGATSKRQVCFQLAPLLDLSILNGDTTSLVINDDVPGFITYGGNQNNLLPSGSRDLDVPPISSSDGSGGLAERDQENRVTNSVAVAAAFHSVGGSYVDPLLGAQTAEEQQTYRGLMVSKLVSRSSANRQNSRDGATQSATQDINATATTTGSLDPVTVLDVSFPLFYYVWGFSPIAGLEMGADLSLLAQFIAKTTLRSSDSGSLEIVDALTRQIVDVSIGFYADLDVLFDLVDGEFTLSPVLCAGVQIEKPSANPVRELARVRLDMNYLISIWTPPPFPNIEAEDTITLASEGDQECQSINQTASASGKGSSLYEESPARMRVSLATDVPPAGEAEQYLGFTAYNAAIANPGPSDAGKTVLFVKRPGQSPVEIVRAYGIRQLDIEYYASNRAVLVWVQNADPPPTSGANSFAQVAQVASRQHVRYSRWNGTSWSAPINLTAPGSGGEGGLSLAGCHGNHAGCSSGKVLAVWTRSTSGDFRDLRTRVFQSEFTPASGGSWSTPAALDGTGINDSHPTAAYRNGQAIVAWLRNSTGTAASAKNRSLAYRVLDGSSPVRIAGNVPAGVSWPKLAVDGSNRVGIAFAAPDDPRAFLGNRQAVHVAALACISGGNCSFNTLKVKDRRGRSVYAERPIPVWDHSGTLFVGYRGVSYSADSAGTTRNYSEDPPGIRFKTGEAMMFASTLTSITVDPIALSNDGAGYANLDLAFDGVAGSVIAAGVRNANIALQAAKRAKTFNIGIKPAAAAEVPITDDIVSLERMLGPDIAITDVTLSLDALVPGSTRAVDVSLINRGTVYVPGPAAPMSLRAYWDNPSASGGPAVSFGMASLDSGATRNVQLVVPVPSTFVADEQHVLYIRAVDGSGDLVDVDSSNNQRAIAIGGMPVPQGLSSGTQPNLPLVRLEWSAIPAAQVKGYRIYRQNGSGPIVPLGSTPVAAFVDISASFDVARNYYVSTYSARGIESPLSEPIAVMPVKLLADGLFADSFE